MSGIGVGCQIGTSYWIVKKNGNRGSFILKRKRSEGRLAVFEFDTDGMYRSELRPQGPDSENMRPFNGHDTHE